MTRLFLSPWMTALLGCVLYLGTTFAFIRTNHFTAVSPDPIERSAEDDPSWKFKNPEIDQWIAQMKNEKEAMSLREQQLNEWQARLEAERKEITTVTQTVASIQADFDKYVVRFRAQETENIKHQAKLIAAMSPLGAATLFGEMNDDAVVRILFTMKTDEASVILDTMSKLGKPEARRAADLTARLQHVLPNSTNAAPAASP